MKTTPVIVLGVIMLLNGIAGGENPQERKSKNNVSDGVLVSVEEIIKIKELASNKAEPYNTDRTMFLDFIDKLLQSSAYWEELSGEIVISGGSSSEPVQLSSTGGKLVYGAAIAWHLTGELKYAIRCRELILDLVNTYGYRNAEQKEFHWGAQGILNLARGGTPYIYAACLLEGWEGWTNEDKLKFQVWLRDEMFPKVAWASRTRKNNWGVAGSFSASVISFYLMEHENWVLEEIHPVKRSLSPLKAFNAHNELQVIRMSTAPEHKMDAKAKLWGILPNGAIPEEIRRGNDPVDGDHLESKGSGTEYTMTHIEHLVAHAEFLHRRGNNLLYDHVAADGSGSLLQAVLFVIDNPVKSHCFTIDRMNALYMAYNYYKHPALLKSIEKCGPSNIAGQRLALYGRLTHAIETAAQ